MMERLRVETDGPVAWVWLDRPDRLNALDDTALTELRETFEALDGDETVRAAVVAATGPIFSAGFDVRWMSGLDTETVAGEQEGIRAVYDTIEAFTKPLVAAVHAPAMGGGLLLALVSDIRLASEGASFGAPEVKIGIFPSLDLVPRLEHVVGLGVAKRMVLTGDPITAVEAERIGLIEPLVPADELVHLPPQHLAEVGDDHGGGLHHRVAGDLRLRALGRADPPPRLSEGRLDRVQPLHLHRQHTPAPRTTEIAAGHIAVGVL
jgi:enoyl-CoA hydratase/carnithine racemase